MSSSQTSRPFSAPAPPIPSSLPKPPSILDSLDEDQRKAVFANVNAPLAIIAGAGSGKTRTLCARICYMLQQGVPATSILALTFTSKAAQEMRERVIAAVGPQTGQSLTVRTFHSFCLSLLHSAYLTGGERREYTVFDRKKQLEAMREALESWRIGHPTSAPLRSAANGGDRQSGSGSGPIFARGAKSGKKEDKKGKKGNKKEVDEAEWMLKWVQKQKSKGRSPVDFVDMHAWVFKAYQTILEENHALDFVDMIKEVVKALEGNEAALKACQRRYQYLLVDEFQDTSPSQFRILQLIGGSEGRITVVGDDDQAIYGFRGGTPDIFHSFLSLHTKAEQHVLPKNYRSTHRIVAAAAAVIQSNPSRMPKEIHAAEHNEVGPPVSICIASTVEQEVNHVAMRITELVDSGTARYGDIAVLCRIGKNVLSAFHKELKKRGIPCVRFFGTQRRKTKPAAPPSSSQPSSSQAMVTGSQRGGSGGRPPWSGASSFGGSAIRQYPAPPIFGGQSKSHGASGSGGAEDIGRYQIGLQDRSAVKDILSYLTLSVNPHDNNSFWRVLNVPKRGFGDKAEEYISEVHADLQRVRNGQLSLAEAFPSDTDSKPAKGKRRSVKQEEKRELPVVLTESLSLSQAVVMAQGMGFPTTRGGRKLTKPQQEGLTGYVGLIREMGEAVMECESVVDAVKLVIERVGYEEHANKKLREEIRKKIMMGRAKAMNARLSASQSSTPWEDGDGSGSEGGDFSEISDEEEWAEEMYGADRNIQKVLKEAETFDAKLVHEDEDLLLSTQMPPSSRQVKQEGEDDDGLFDFSSQGESAATQKRGEVSMRDRVLQFLGELALLTGEEESGADGGKQDAVAVTTIHQSKGLEWPHVFVVRVNEGVLPLRRPRTEEEEAQENGEEGEDETEADSGVGDEGSMHSASLMEHLQEERRLIYVAMSRARQSLSISYIKSGGEDGQRAHEPSRFLLDLPGSLTVLHGQEQPAADSGPPTTPMQFNRSQFKKSPPNAAPTTSTTTPSRAVPPTLGFTTTPSPAKNVPQPSFLPRNNQFRKASANTSEPFVPPPPPLPPSPTQPPLLRVKQFGGGSTSTPSRPPPVTPLAPPQQTFVPSIPRQFGASPKAPATAPTSQKPRQFGGSAPLPTTPATQRRTETQPMPSPQTPSFPRAPSQFGGGRASQFSGPTQTSPAGRTTSPFSIAPLSQTPSPTQSVAAAASQPATQLTPSPTQPRPKMKQEERDNLSQPTPTPPAKKPKLPNFGDDEFFDFAEDDIFGLPMDVHSDSPNLHTQ